MVEVKGSVKVEWNGHKVSSISFWLKVIAISLNYMYRYRTVQKHSPPYKADVSWTINISSGSATTRVYCWPTASLFAHPSDVSFVLLGSHEEEEMFLSSHYSLMPIFFFFFFFLGGELNFADIFLLKMSSFCVCQHSVDFVFSYNLLADFFLLQMSSWVLYSKICYTDAFLLQMYSSKNVQCSANGTML